MCSCTEVTWIHLVIGVSTWPYVLITILIKIIEIAMNQCHGELNLQKSHRPCLYETRSPWSVDQDSIGKSSIFHNAASTVKKYSDKWEGQAIQLDTKFRKRRAKIADFIFTWSLIHGLRCSGFIKVGPEISSSYPNKFNWSDTRQQKTLMSEGISLWPD